MWLRDSLARERHLPNVRIMVYGYNTQMEGSTSFTNLDDLANEFEDKIKSIRSYPRVKRTELQSASPERPLILLGHSLGGLVIKQVRPFPFFAKISRLTCPQTILRMRDGDKSDKANLNSICGMLFFGVPNLGMPIEQWIPMVENQSNRFFVEQLGKASDILRVIGMEFPKAFPFEDSKIYSFYETKKSPKGQRGVSRPDGMQKFR